MPKKTIFSGFFKRAEAFRGLPMFSKVTSFDPCGSLSAMIVRASSEVTRCIVKFSMNRLSGSIIEGHPTAESPTSDHCFKSRHEKCFCNIRKTIFDSHSTVHTVKCPFTLSAIDSRWKRLAIKKRKSWLRFEKLRLEYGSEKLIRNDSNSFGSRSSFASACDSAPHSGSDRSADLIRLAQFMAPLAVPSLYPAADSDLSAGRAVGLLRPTFLHAHRAVHGRSCLTLPQRARPRIVKIEDRTIFLQVRNKRYGSPFKIIEVRVLCHLIFVSRRKSSQFPTKFLPTFFGVSPQTGSFKRRVWTV